MSARAASLLAWALCLLCVALLAVRVVLLFLNRVTTLATGGWGTANYAFILLVVILSFTLVGALISSRLPANPVGWICLSVGLIMALEAVADGYYVYALQTRPGLPGGEYMAWLGNWLWIPWLFLIGTFMVLLFPDGRLPSRRWRVVAWLSVAALISLGASYAFYPGRLDEAPDVINPLGIESAGSVLGLVYAWDLLLLLPCLVAAALSMVLRFRRSTGEVLQQIKWFAAAAVFQTMAFSSYFASYFVVSSRVLVLEDFVALTFAGLPVAVGIAILRHRLYDIDVVINRALVYGPLTVTLAAIYFGGVVSLQYAFRALTGGGSQLVIVASTLAIAALFDPLRRRIQALVDRRFYRGKYDAAKTMEDFSRRLRDETDLDALREGSVAVVRETVRPEHISLWLRPRSEAKKADGGP